MSAFGGKATSDEDRKSTRLNSSHSQSSYAVFCLKKKKKKRPQRRFRRRPRRESDRVMGALRPGNAGGAKDPDSGALSRPSASSTCVRKRESAESFGANHAKRDTARRRGRSHRRIARG